MVDFIFLVFLSVVPLRNLAPLLTFREYANEACGAAVPFLFNQMESTGVRGGMGGAVRGGADLYSSVARYEMGTSWEH